MRKMQYLAVILTVLLLNGCSGGQDLPRNTLPTIPQQITGEALSPFPMTRSGRILERLWHFYDGERFLGYGGSDPSPGAGPGELDLSDRRAALEKFYLPPEYWDQITEGASLIHLLNPNAFTCGVFCLEHTDLSGAAKAWRESIHRQRWQGSKPEQLLLMELDQAHILLVLGKPQMVRGMENAAKKVFAQCRLLYRDGLAGG
jgi:hypothetical protein